MTAQHSEAEAFAREYRQLIGMTVADVVMTPASDFVGLVFTCKGKRKIAWVQCDPEGNGHGFLAIEEA